MGAYRWTFSRHLHRIDNGALGSLASSEAPTASAITLFFAKVFYGSRYNMSADSVAELLKLKQASQVMAPVPMANGVSNGMPLTEYTANPDKNPSEKTPASALLPESFLIPDGHPDVRTCSSISQLPADSTSISA